MSFFATLLSSLKFVSHHSYSITCTYLVIESPLIFFYSIANETSSEDKHIPLIIFFRNISEHLPVWLSAASPFTGPAPSHLVLHVCRARSTTAAPGQLAGHKLRTPQPGGVYRSSRARTAPNYGTTKMGRRVRAAGRAVRSLGWSWK